MKAHIALWLANRGATDLVISVDGAEPNPADVVDILKGAGYSRHAPPKSPSWTGIYTTANHRDIRVTSQAGPDVRAAMPSGTRLLGECKGQPTASGVKAGLDLTGFYTALGQLIVAAGDEQADALKTWAKRGNHPPSKNRLGMRDRRHGQRPCSISRCGGV